MLVFVKNKWKINRLLPTSWKTCFNILFFLFFKVLIWLVTNFYKPFKNVGGSCIVHNFRVSFHDLLFLDHIWIILCTYEMFKEVGKRYKKCAKNVIITSYFPFCTAHFVAMLNTWLFFNVHICNLNCSKSHTYTVTQNQALSSWLVQKKWYCDYDCHYLSSPTWTWKLFE